MEGQRQGQSTKPVPQGLTGFQPHRFNFSLHDLCAPSWPPVSELLILAYIMIGFSSWVLIALAVISSRSEFPCKPLTSLQSCMRHCETQSHWWPQTLLAPQPLEVDVCPSPTPRSCLNFIRWKVTSAQGAQASIFTPHSCHAQVLEQAVSRDAQAPPHPKPNARILWFELMYQSPTKAAVDFME